MAVRFQETFLTETQKHLLEYLGKLPKGMGYADPEAEHGPVAHDYDVLVEKGLVENVVGLFGITEAGRSRLRSNSGE